MAGPQRLPRNPKQATPKQAAKKASTTGVSLETFGSISEFAERVHAFELAGTQGGPKSGTSSKKADSEKWCKHTTLDAAVEIGLNGGYWAEGAKDLQAVEISQGAQDTILLKPAYELSAVGGCVDVGEYLHGNPECMLGFVDDEQSTPVITITYVSTMLCSILSGEKMNYGRAILALVDSLEKQGYSVELVAKLGFTDRYKNGFRGTEADVTVKQAGQDWNASAVAFSIAHPAFSRRLGFRFAEAMPEAERATSGGYGQGHGVHRQEGGIFLPYLDDGYDVRTPERALAHVVSLAKQCKPELFQ